MNHLLRRGLLRLALHVVRIALLPLEVARPRLYMRLYIPLLLRCGLKIDGTPRYISSSARFDDFHLTHLGNRVVLSRTVILLTHDYSITTALLALGQEIESDIGLRRPIRIGNNVFVGMNAVLLPGTIIEDNVIIGAGSVVRGLVQSDSIVVGNPATTIGTISEREDRWHSYSKSEFAKADGD